MPIDRRFTANARTYNPSALRISGLRAVTLLGGLAFALFGAYERELGIKVIADQHLEPRASFAETNPATLTPEVTAAIDRAMRADDLAPPAATKTVPIVSYDGPIGYYGAAHLSGSPSALARTTAVLWLSPKTRIGLWPLRPLVPIARMDANGRPERVAGVGVDALLWDSSHEHK